VALAPLWFLIHHLPKGAIWLGAAWGIGYHGLALSWITGVHPMTWMGVPWLTSLAIALFCWFAITLWGATLTAVWAWGMCQFSILDSRFWISPTKIRNPKSNSPWHRITFGIALWCSLEWLWSQSPLWWTSFSYTQSPDNLVILHLGQLSGPLTVTAALVLVNGLIAEAFLSVNKRGRYLAIAIGLLIGLHLLGLGLYSRPLAQLPESALKVGIIQGNIPNEIKLYSEGGRQALEGYTRGYRALADQGVDAVLTPETALPFLWTSPETTNRSFYQAILEQGIVAWVGAYGQQDQKLTNSLFTMTSTGQTLSRYDKAKLVPIGEYIPFEHLLGDLVDRLSPLEAQLAFGSSRQHFETPFGRAIVGICYESAFPGHFQAQAAAGGQFVLSASNNAHYSTTMPAQHHAQDVMRAVEIDRWAVRATNTGYSGIIDPHGNTHWLSDINTYEIHAAVIYRRQTQTLYVRWGNWLTPLLIILAVITRTVNSKYST
jgi:apolipoprotein N-acyltransferase